MKINVYTYHVTILCNFNQNNFNNFKEISTEFELERFQFLHFLN